jgi:hypothetical protein
MNPLAIFSGPYALLIKWGVIAALVAAFAGFFWIKGDEHGTEKLTDYVGKQALETVRIGAARVEIVNKIETVYVDKIKTAYLKGQTIEKEVVKYVTKTDDAACIVPVGFVREFNAAWRNIPPGPAEESDRQPSGVPLSAVAQTLDYNATACQAYKIQRDGLIEFYRAQQKVK